MSIKKRCLIAVCTLSMMSAASVVTADVIVTGGDPDSIYFNDRAVGGAYMTRDGVGVGVNAWDANPAERQFDQGRYGNGFSGDYSHQMGGDAIGGRGAGGGRR